MSNETLASSIITYKQGGSWTDGIEIPDDYTTTPNSPVNGMGAVVVNERLYILGE